MLDYLIQNSILLASILAVVLIYFGVSYWVYVVIVGVVLQTLGVTTNTIMLVVGLMSLFVFSFTRRFIFAWPAFTTMKLLKFLPTISKTEKEAIEAGSTWVDKDLFSGAPNFNKVLSYEYSQLTKEEQEYLDGPVEDLCELVNDWEVYQQKDFPDVVWNMFSKGRFFGLIIPKEYGGLGFSARANSAIVGKISSRSTPLGITVMVPNSLGPAELLTHYGTKSQKEYYLPRLATAKEIPCFALTEPNAGSDAGAMTSSGVVFKNEKGETYLRLNWDKRYITLASKATLLGLAFKCYDPENILGNGEDCGITCALIPTSSKGVVIGERHDPLGVPFYNCPTQGVNVEVPIDAVIGGDAYVGKGWSMLMECLSAGRGISLPATCAAGTKYTSRVVSAYSMIRKQFGLEIGKFTGIQQPMSEIVGLSYLLEATRKYTCGGLDSGAKPAVITAIAKYHFTENFRKIVTHGMDIVGGAGISLGPRNLLGHAYIAAPIGVTVEGANILTRTLMIFGQGAIRCHPHALEEIYAIESNDLGRFDKAFWGHMGHVVKNLVRMIVLEISRGILVIPARFNATSRYYQKLTWVSAKFAFFADVAMILFGGGLKLKERITARFGDVLSWMYLATSVLRRYEAEGRLKEDLPFVHWSIQYSLYQIQVAFEGLFKNMGPVFWIFKFISQLNPVGSYPSDKLSTKICKIMQTPGKQRDRLTEGIYISEDKNDPLGRLEHAFEMLAKVAPLHKKIKSGIRKGVIKKGHINQMIADAQKANVISKQEAQQVSLAEELREDAVKVDNFTQEEYMKSANSEVKRDLKES